MAKSISRNKAHFSPSLLSVHILVFGSNSAEDSQSSNPSMIALSFGLSLCCVRCGIAVPAEDIAANRCRCSVEVCECKTEEDESLWHTDVVCCWHNALQWNACVDQ